MKKIAVFLFLTLSFNSLVFGFQNQKSLSEMKVIFFPSAVCFFFADGGSMLVDIGNGTNQVVLKQIKEKLIPREFVFNLFQPFGWKPRIDWLIMVPRGDIWDDKVTTLLNNYTFGEIYFPQKPNTYRTGEYKNTFHRGVSKIILEIALAKNSINSLENINKIDLGQSNSNIKCEKLELENSQMSNYSSQGSLCLLITYNKSKILIASELSDVQQQYILKNNLSKIKADIIYSTNGLSPNFVNAVDAKWFIIVDGLTKTFELNGSSVIETEN